MKAFAGVIAFQVSTLGAILVFFGGPGFSVSMYEQAEVLGL